MRDENPIRNLGDYSKPSHKGYRNTIELLVGNNVVPLRSDIIWLVQNRCSFHGLRFEDPNQHLKDFLKLVDSLDLDRSITTWEDLTTRFIAKLFTLGRTAKLRNDISMFQQHHGESLSEAWTRFNDLLQKVPHHGIDLWLKVQIFYDHVNPVTRRTINQLAGGKLRDRNAKEPWALLEDLALYDNESWNDPRDFAKLVKAITLPQDVPSTSDRRLIKLENQVQRLMEAYLDPMQPTQVNKITTPRECSPKVRALDGMTGRTGGFTSPMMKNEIAFGSDVINSPSSIYGFFHLLHVTVSGYRLQQRYLGVVTTPPNVTPKHNTHILHLTNVVWKPSEPFYKIFQVPYPLHFLYKVIVFYDTKQRCSRSENQVGPTKTEPDQNRLCPKHRIEDQTKMVWSSPVRSSVQSNPVQ
nr:zinc finger, CCHC-type [Tanacetum cinerariifolium]